MPVAPWLTTTRSAPGGTASTAETEIKVGKKEAGGVVGTAKSKTASRGVREAGGSSVGAKGFEPLAGAVGTAELARQRDPLWEYKQQASMLPLLRRPSLKELLRPTREAMVCKMDLSHKRVMRDGGVLRIQPLQALHLANTQRRVYVVVKTHLQRGDFLWRSEKATVAAAPTWDRNQHVCEFKVEALEASGILSLSVFAEVGVTDIRSDVELGRLDIQLGGLIDCCSYRARSEYQRWFPLSPPTHKAEDPLFGGEAEGDGNGDVGRWTNATEQRRATDFAHYNPVIQLAARWVADDCESGYDSAAASRGPSRSYVSALLGEVSMSLVDNKRAKELLHLSVKGVDGRYAESQEMTRGSCVVGWVQLDNQTNDPVAPVVVAPTMVEHPQATLQMSFIRNNIKSHSHLNHFEYVAVMLQELDVRLEQAILTDLVQFVVDRLDYQRASRDVYNRKAVGLLALQASSSAPAAPVEGGVSRRNRSSGDSVGGKGSKEGSKGHDPKGGEHEEDLDARRAGDSRGVGRGGDLLKEELHVYIAAMQLFPIKLNFSFIKNADVKDLFRLLDQREQEKMEWEWLEGGIEGRAKVAPLSLSHGLAGNFPRLLLEFVINLTNDISTSPVRLNGMKIPHLWNTPRQLANSLQSHYVGALLRQLYKIVGSFDFLGDPVGVLSQLGTGVKDFFYEPAEGLMKSPTAFGKGVAKGTMSLVGNTTSGVLGFTTKITRSVGGGVAALSFDEEFQRRRIIRRREAGGGSVDRRNSSKGARGAARMMVHAVRDLGGGIYHGLTGVVLEPYRKAKEDGVQGFVTGIFQGLAGVATKPMVGCLDAVTHTGEAMRAMAGGLSSGDSARSARRSRFPQPFGPDGRIMPRTAETACGALLLARFPLWKSRHSFSREVMPTGPPSTQTPSGGISMDTLPSVGPRLDSAALDESIYSVQSFAKQSPLHAVGPADDHFEGAEAASRDWGSPLSEPGSPRGNFAAKAEVNSAIAGGGGGGSSGMVQAKETRRRRSRRDVCEPDFVVSTEFLPRSGGEAIILVISNRRVLCVRASLRGGGSGLSGGGSGLSGGGGGVGGSGGGGGGGGGGSGGLRGSGIACLELEWQLQLNALTGLPGLLDEDGGGTTLDFTHVIGAADIASGRRRDGRLGLRNTLHRGRIAGLAVVLGATDGVGGSGLSQSHPRSRQDSTPAPSGGGGGGGGGGSGDGGKRAALPPRRVEGMYRDRPALIRAYNVVACLTHRFGRVLLTPGGGTVSGSKTVVRYHPRLASVDGDDSQLSAGERETERAGGPSVISINGWEFGEDPREHPSSMAQAATRNSFGSSSASVVRVPVFSGLGSPRMVEDGRGLSSDLVEPATLAARSDCFPAYRGDAFPPRDVWMPLSLLAPQIGFGPPDKMRRVPNAFEMDAVVWKPGPFAPESDPGSGWLSAARVAALETSNKLISLAVDSEALPDNSERALEVKNQFRQGKMGRAEFARTMFELRRSGKDRVIEARRRTVMGTGAGLIVSTGSSRSLGTDAWLRRDNSTDGRGGGGGSSANQESGSTSSSKQRQGNSSGMLGKLGGRLVAGLATASLRLDQAASGVGSGQGGSPAPDGPRSDGGRRRKSNRRNFDSPRDQDVALESSGGSERRPWSVPHTTSRSVRRIFSGPSSPERQAPSPGGTPVRGGDSVGEGRQSPAHYPGRTEHSIGAGGGVRGSISDAGGGRGGGSVGSAGAPPPLTASEIDNMSSISNTSTVLTDLSVRLEKIEDMLSRLLDAQKPPPRDGGGGDGGGGGSGGVGGGGGGGDSEGLSRQGRFRTQGVQQVEHGRGHETGQTNGTTSDAKRPPTVDEESEAGFAGVVRDTSLELREVRGRLRLLEVEEAARVATAFPETNATSTSRGKVATPGQLSSEPPPLSGARSTNPTPPAERHTERYSALAAAGSAAGSGGGGSAGDNLIRGGAPASELPVFEQEDEEEEEEEGLSSGEGPSPRKAFAVPPSEQAVGRDAAEKRATAASASSGSAAANSGFEPARGAEKKGDSRDRGEEKGGGEEDGDDVKGDGQTSPPGGRLQGSALRRPRSFILSTISEAPV